MTWHIDDSNLRTSLIRPGKVQLREVATESHLDANVKFKINDSYRTKNDKTKLLFGAPGSKEKPMLEMDPKMGKSKTSDGFYALRVGGTLKFKGRLGVGGRGQLGVSIDRRCDASIEEEG